MRVAHIINSLTRASGLSYFCAKMTQHLAESGVDIDLYVWWVGDDALLPDHERITVYETKETGFQPAQRPDIVHVHALWVPMAHEGCVYAQKQGIPYIISPHGMLTPWALRHKWWKKLPGMMFFQYWDLNRAHMLHATAQSEVADMRRLYLKQDVAVVSLGTDLPVIPSEELNDSVGQNGMASGSQLHGDPTRTILFLSRVHPVKGLKNLLKAWATIKNDWEGEGQWHDRPGQLVRWRLIIAGPDEMEHKSELLGLAQSLQMNTCDLSDNFQLSRLEEIDKDTDIVFTGPVYGEDKNIIHDLANLFVLPTFSENFGVVVADSLAHGVPVITTKGTPWMELEGRKRESNEQSSANYPPEGTSAQMEDSLSSGRCGWWVDIGIEPLVMALREAMSMTDEQRHRMGENGRRLVEEKYTWPVVAKGMMKAYERMLVT